jgi:hypothetical protein
MRSDQVRRHLAGWQINEDDEALCLQIELGNDHAVTLSYPKNGDQPSVALWWGGGEHDFDQDTLQSFREWIGRASPQPGAA